MIKYYFILISTILVFSGCASAVLKSGCGHINGAEVTIPYVGGKANGQPGKCVTGITGVNCTSCT